MKVSISETKEILIEEVYNPVILKTNSGEELSICMRDTGFEFNYQGKMYFAKEGTVEPFRRSERGNVLVDQRPHTDGENASAPGSGKK